MWAVGVLANRRATWAAIASAPESWRERFAAEYGEILSSRLRRVVLSRSAVYASVLWLVVFALLEWGDVTLGIQLEAALVYSVWATASDRRRQREEVARWEASGLEPLQRDPSLAWAYVGSLFAMIFGFIATMCFAVRAVVELTGA